MFVLVASANLVAAAALTLLTPGAVAWPSHTVVLILAAYTYASRPFHTHSISLAAVLWPPLAISSARAFDVPMTSMLSRLPELHLATGPPPLWAKGGVALLPIVTFSLAQACLVVMLAQVAERRVANRLRLSLLTAGLVTLVSVVAFLVAAAVGVVCAGLSADTGLFPRSRNAYFGLFWMSVTIGLLQPPGALLGGLLIQRWAARGRDKDERWPRWADDVTAHSGVRDGP